MAPIPGSVAAIARAIGLALVVAACGPDVSTPAPATLSPTPDPRLEEVAEAEGIWRRQRPPTVAYTTVETPDGAAPSVVRVTEMDGHAEALAITTGSNPPPIGRDQTIDGILERAADALGRGDRQVSLAYDTLYGYVTRLELAGAGSTDRTTSTEVRDLVTAADRTSDSRARDQLEALLRAWRSLASPTWEYTWHRFSAAESPGGGTLVRIRHEDGRTTMASTPGASGEAARDAATIQGTVEAAIGVIAAGGWVDVALDEAGLDALIAIDPSPSAKGDAYWIRIDYTDLYATRAREALAGARERWSTGAPASYAYRWRYQGDAASWTWTVTVSSDAATIKPGKGAPPAERAFVGPGVEALFDLIAAVVDAGGVVRAAYDPALGYPSSVTISDGAGVAPNGTITIGSFRAG